MELILDVELGEDEQMQSQSSRGIEIFGEQSYLSGYMEANQEQFQQHEEMGGQDADTQQPVVLQPPVKSMAEIQVVVAGTQADVEIEIHEEFVTQEPMSSQLNAKVVEGDL